MLARRIGELRDVRHLLAPDDLRHAEERLVLADATPEVLWEKLLAHAAECEGEYAGAQDSRLVFRLTEALARHPEFATPRALEILRDRLERGVLHVTRLGAELAGSLARLHADCTNLVVEALGHGRGTIARQNPIARCTPTSA